MCQLGDAKRGAVDDGSAVSTEKPEHRRAGAASPGAVAHSLQVVVDVVSTVEVELIVSVDLDTGVEEEVVLVLVLVAAPVLLGVSPAISVAVVTSTEVVVSQVHKVSVSVLDDVVTVVSVETQVVLTVTDSVMAGRGGLVGVPGSTVTFPERDGGMSERDTEATSALSVVASVWQQGGLASDKKGVKAVMMEVDGMGVLELPETVGPETDVTPPDIAAPDGLDTPEEDSVEKTGVLESSTVEDSEAELAGLALEALKAVNVVVPLLMVVVKAPVGSATEVAFPREKGVGIPLSDTMDVLVVK